MQGLGFLSIIGALVLMLLGIGDCQGNEIAVNGNLNLAKIAPDAALMREYVEAAMNQMEGRGLQVGGPSLSSQPSYSDIYAALQANRDELRRLEQLPRESADYQSGVSNVRGALSAIKFEGGHSTFNTIYMVGTILLLVLGALLYNLGPRMQKSRARQTAFIQQGSP